MGHNGWIFGYIGIRRFCFFTRSRRTLISDQPYVREKTDSRLSTWECGACLHTHTHTRAHRHINARTHTHTNMIYEKTLSKLPCMYSFNNYSTHLAHMTKMRFCRMRARGFLRSTSVAPKTPKFFAVHFLLHTPEVSRRNSISLDAPSTYGTPV